MTDGGTSYKPLPLARSLALLACASLLFFALGGTLFHQHSNTPETACHLCQSLHMPALASASLPLVSAPELIARYLSPSGLMSPSDSVSLHRASRAPPQA